MTENSNNALIAEFMQLKRALVHELDEFDIMVDKFHTYPAPDLEEEKVYEGDELAGPIWQKNHAQGEGRTDWQDLSEDKVESITILKAKGYQLRQIIRLKQPATPTSDGKGGNGGGSCIG